MKQLENLRSPDTTKETQPSISFTDFREDLRDSILIRSKSSSSKIMDLFGTVEITDEPPPPNPFDDHPNIKAALKAGEETIKDIEDAASLEGPSKELALQNLKNKIQSFSTLPDSDFVFDLYYVDIRQDLTNDGRNDLLLSFVNLDKDHVLRDELDTDYLQRHGSDKAGVIYDQVNDSVSQILDIAKHVTDPNTTDFSTVLQKIRTDLSQLTKEEQYVYTYNLAAELQSNSKLGSLLDNDHNDGRLLLYGIFSVPPVNSPWEPDSVNL